MDSPLWNPDSDNVVLEVQPQQAIGSPETRKGKLSQLRLPDQRCPRQHTNSSLTMSQQFDANNAQNAVEVRHRRLSLNPIN